jgi:hypothetical protein
MDSKEENFAAETNEGTKLEQVVLPKEGTKRKVSQL